MKNSFVLYLWREMNVSWNYFFLFSLILILTLEMTRPCHLLYLLYKWKRCQARKSMLICFKNRNNMVVENIYLNNLCLIFNLLAVIYECFEFCYLFVCVRSYILIYTTDICPLRMEQYKLYWILKYIIISIAFVSGAEILDKFGISFLHLYVEVVCIFNIFYGNI